MQLIPGSSENRKINKLAHAFQDKKVLYNLAREIINSTIPLITQSTQKDWKISEITELNPKIFSKIKVKNTEMS